MLNKLKKILISYLFNQQIDLAKSDDLKRKVIVVTGAGKGIGRATAEVLLNNGAVLVLVSRSKKDLVKITQRYPKSRSVLFEGDVANQQDVKKVSELVEAKFGKIDVLINNAGVFLDKPLDEISTFEFTRLFDVNLKGVFLMTNTFLPMMKKQQKGFIINIGSKISHNTNVVPNKVLYATAKYALEGFSFALNKELKRFGIRVSCLMPGTVNTFFSFKSGNFLSPYQIGQIILMMILNEGIDFEGLIIKSVKQDI